MNATTTHTGKQILFTAISLAFVPIIAFGQNKADSNSTTSSAASGQVGNSSAGNAVPADSAAAESGEHARKQKSRAQGNQETGATASAVFLLIPVNAPEQNEWMKKGCWAKFYDGKDFSGDNLMLMGPVDMPDMTGPFGIDWKGKISSIETGSKARILVYDNKGYKDLVSTFKPGQRSADVSKKMGFFDEFSSVKITCDNLKSKDASQS